jgi:hypothetical protein
LLPYFAFCLGFRLRIFLFTSFRFHIFVSLQNKNKIEDVFLSFSLKIFKYLCCLFFLCFFHFACPSSYPKFVSNIKLILPRYSNLKLVVLILYAKCVKCLFF